MNADHLFEAIGEVAPEKLLHSEEAKPVRSHKAVRMIGILAAAFAILAAMTLVVNAATEGAVLNTLRIWLNGEPVQANDPKLNQIDTNDYEYFVAKTDKKGEWLEIQRYRSDNNGQELGFTLQKHSVVERDGKIILLYDSDEIDLTEPFKHSDKCVVDYTVSWSDSLKTHVLITVQRSPEGQYYVFSEPVK